MNKEKRIEKGIDLPDATWNSIVTLAEEYSINVNDYINIK
jgi:hypothetical protein